MQAGKICGDRSIKENVAGSVNCPPAARRNAAHNGEIRNACRFELGSGGQKRSLRRAFKQVMPRRLFGASIRGATHHYFNNRLNLSID